MNKIILNDFVEWLTEDQRKETTKDIITTLFTSYKDAIKLANTEGRSDCYRCKYRGGVPGSAHSSCTAEFRSRFMVPNFDDHGIKNGWAMFPWNFDPVWMITKCINFKQK